MFKNCKRCGGVFNSVTLHICNECSNSEKDQYNKVKEYLEKNPGLNLIQLSKATGVKADIILRYIKEDRFEY
ncbi:MAG: hypothetical protein FWF57_08360 [Defluviitaleaceae bacterium]|nr:hypothetical protein [Defluviitaleaceae bacterium]